MVSIEQKIPPAQTREPVRPQDQDFPAPAPHQPRILVVDDDAAVRETLMLLLDHAGYSTAGAQSAFEALEQIKNATPDVLLCDLEMPNMSGFEFLSIVRSRFPQIAVIAMSGAFGSDLPEAVLADGFYSKGHRNPSDLFRMVAGVLAPTAPASPRQERPVVWSHWISRDAEGKSFVLVSCTECLRPFPVAMNVSLGRKIRAAECAFCGAEVRYVAEQYSADNNFGAVFSAVLVPSMLTQNHAQQSQPQTGRCDS